MVPETERAVIIVVRNTKYVCARASEAAKPYNFSVT